jgi:membrane-associated phospholipid phosphatase
MDSPEKRPPASGWPGRAWSRIRFRWFTKMAGTVVFMAAFFIGYFWLLGHPRYPLTTVPRTFVDRLVPFQPAALALYVSLWVYAPLAPALLRTGREMWSYAAAAVALSLAGFAVFFLWPTTVPKPEVYPSPVGPVSFLKAVDASGNAFPSLHVAFAVFSALWIGRLLREMDAGGLARALNWAWCIGIIYSTLAIRQHVALDALSGAALGAAAAALHMRILRGRPGGAPAPAAS